MNVTTLFFADATLLFSVLNLKIEHCSKPDVLAKPDCLFFSIIDNINIVVILIIIIIIIITIPVRNHPLWNERLLFEIVRLCRVKANLSHYLENTI